MIVILLLICCCIIVVVAGGGGYFFLTQKNEGDECEGDDENGTYVIDADGKCILESCDIGYRKVGEECVEFSTNSPCTPSGTSDPQGKYVYDSEGNCIFDSCNSGYNVLGTTCIEDQSGSVCTPSDTPDPQGNYLTNAAGVCVLNSCNVGYDKVGPTCIRDATGEECEPEGSNDPHGVYRIGQSGGCDFSGCQYGYILNNDTCEWGGINARYVSIIRPFGTYADETSILNIAEIEVFDPAGINVALNATVTGGPENHGAGPWANLTDGKYDNFAHTIGDGVPFMTIDLGAMKEIARVVITNRAGYSGSGRLQNARVLLLNANEDIIKTTEKIKNEKMKMTYDFRATSPAWEYADN
jgi:hypothetical protein